MAKYQNDIVWRKIPNFPDYEVSNDGRVRRITAPRNWRRSIKPIPYELKLISDAYGYRTVRIWKPKISKFQTITVHRLVMHAFIGPPPTRKHEVAHANGCKSDNRLSNLRWATSKQNKDDAKKHGTLSRGTRQHMSKLTEETVRELRSMTMKRGDQRKIAKRLGVSPAAICEALSGQTWAHVRPNTSVSDDR